MDNREDTIIDAEYTETKTPENDDLPTLVTARMLPERITSSKVFSWGKRLAAVVGVLLLVALVGLYLRGSYLAASGL